MSHLFVQQPKLRLGSKIVENTEYLTLKYRNESFELYPDENTTLEAIASFLVSLDGTKTVEELKASKILPFELVQDVLLVLDENCLLEDGKVSEFKGKSGLEFFLELVDLHRQWEAGLGESEFSKLFYSGKAPRELIIGWTIEYYHITKRTHDCVTPAIAKAHGAIRNHVIEFFHEEYRHDKLLLKSLLTLGFSEEEIANSIPLPYTTSLSNMLAKWSHTDLLSFMASLFLYEGNASEGHDYIEALEKYGLPKEFVAQQGVHNDINVEGEHGNVTREFFSLIDYVSPEDQLRVKKNIAMLNQVYRQAINNIAEYYGHEGAELPRTLASLSKVVVQ